MNSDKNNTTPWYKRETKIYRHEFRTTQSEEHRIRELMAESGKNLTELVIDLVKKGEKKDGA